VDRQDPASCRSITRPPGLGFSVQPGCRASGPRPHVIVPPRGDHNRLRGTPGYTTKRAPRTKDRQHTAATIPSSFPLPLTRTAEFFLEVLDAVEAVTVSEAWWTRINMPEIATPMYELASEGANDVVSDENGVVAVMVIRPPVIVCPPRVHVPLTVPRSPSGIICAQPPVGVKAELGSVE
jgi:hypothetical protein